MMFTIWRTTHTSQDDYISNHTY